MDLSKILARISDVVQPLRDLTTKHVQFLWSHQHDRAFQEVKELVVQHPVLEFYNTEEEVTQQCDTSEGGLGATLLQNDQPEAFASRTLTATQRNYAPIEKECLAIVFGCRHFNQYIAGREKVTVESDHKPLQAIFKKSILTASSRLPRLLLRLQRYNLDVHYKKNKDMYIADHFHEYQPQFCREIEKNLKFLQLNSTAQIPSNTLKRGQSDWHTSRNTQARIQHVRHVLK